MAVNYKKLYAIKNKNKQTILSYDNTIPETSGIYILTRFENGFKYAYIGQAQNLLQRLADHLSGYQHIDTSIKKHKLYNEQNKTGWIISYIIYSPEELDQKEKEYIKFYANAGYQMRNKTAGGQGKGKTDLGDKEVKGYQNGLSRGYRRARKDIATLFEKNLIVAINGTPNKNKEKALKKFKEFIKIDEIGEN